MFLASTAVFCDEIIKFCACLLLIWKEYLSHCRDKLSTDSGPTHCSRRTPCMLGYLDYVHQVAIADKKEALKLVVPALAYTIQKNLLYLAVSNLDAAIYQVTYQGKILTTALFSWIVLGTQFTIRKIICLAVLMVGVALVELSKLQSHSNHPNEDPFVGTIAIVCACCTSGFACVYFESVLKNKSRTGSSSIWVRNLQLSFWASILAFGTVLTQDGQKVREGGFFQGYDYVVYITVALEAFGGLVVAMVIKYADTIAKNFATAVSVTICSFLSSYFWDFEITFLFIMGAFLTLFSTYSYNTSPAKIVVVPDEPAVPKLCELSNLKTNECVDRLESGDEVTAKEECGRPSSKR